MTIRERIEQQELNTLSKYASFSVNSKGRKHPAEECHMRTAYQRDRDKIIHCKAFRRLKHKTQVFLSPEGDHYRTRLTHTLEVAQIARTIARALMLNEDLTEAISLGHDLGHTPFGHAGERVLDEICSFGFKHYEQSVRVVEFIEKQGKGLNLTYEVRNGILCHTKGEEAKTLEGRIVKIADKIAYINHDIEDAIRAGVLKNEDIPKEIKKILGNSKSKRITTLIDAVVNFSTDDIIMKKDVKEAFDSLHEFMFKNVYTNPIAKSEEIKVGNLLKQLYIHYINNIEILPKEYLEIEQRDGKEQAVCDYIAGMTDNFVITQFNETFIPKSWSVIK